MRTKYQYEKKDWRIRYNDFQFSWLKFPMSTQEIYWNLFLSYTHFLDKQFYECCRDRGILVSIYKINKLHYSWLLNFYWYILFFSVWVVHVSPDGSRTIFERVTSSCHKLGARSLLLSLRFTSNGREHVYINPRNDSLELVIFDSVYRQVSSLKAQWIFTLFSFLLCMNISIICEYLWMILIPVPYDVSYTDISKK